MSRWTERLISWLGPGVEFSAAEAALLALAPLAHQTDITWSAAQRAVVRPTDLARAEDPDDNRGRYQKFLMAEPYRRLASRAGADRLPGREQAPREIGWWLFHCWVDSELRTKAGQSLDAFLDDHVVADDMHNNLVRALRNLLRGLRCNPNELRTQWSPESIDDAASAHPQVVRELLVDLHPTQRSRPATYDRQHEPPHSHVTAQATPPSLGRRPTPALHLVAGNRSCRTGTPPDRSPAWDIRVGHGRLMTSASRTHQAGHQTVHAPRPADGLPAPAAGAGRGHSDVAGAGGDACPGW